ncbi:aminotransferase class I/II-fold pyridoxal phosphate-dependent enzyme, partial [Streptomyces sp. NPDC058953]|uniref:aminotransferase class I/II-fold pyridoxal phosphate-dependent enzyme n=1 Tax=Streptomyces sp. NPDC058953 TaxID=3346676 RepID=UPI0036AFF229
VLAPPVLEEAAAPGGRFAPSRAGGVALGGTPRELNERPADPWIASFVGEAVLLPATADAGESHAVTALGRVRLTGTAATTAGTVVLRPEQLRLTAPADDAGADAAGRVTEVRYHGHDALVLIELAGLAEPVTVRTLGPLTVRPGAPALLCALIAAHDGDVLMPRPSPAWWTPQARMLRRGAYHVPTPAESGGVPDPYALLETVRRVRAEGGAPRLLLLSVADDPTATVAPPELVLEACEAAVAEGLHIVSDETWRDTLHRPHETVPVSPAEMYPDQVTVVTDLAGALLPSAWPAAVARFPAAQEAHRARALDVLTALGAVVAEPVAAAAAVALDEPAPVVARAEGAAALYGRLAEAAHLAVVAAGALARPPQAGRHVYVDLGPLRAGLTARGVNDSMELEEYLTGRLGAPPPRGPPPSARRWNRSTPYGSSSPATRPTWPPRTTPTRSRRPGRRAGSRP